MEKKLSRQRAWQLRNPEKQKKIVKRYRNTEKYKKWWREYMVEYRKSCPKKILP